MIGKRPRQLDAAMPHPATGVEHERRAPVPTGERLLVSGEVVTGERLFERLCEMGAHPRRQVFMHALLRARGDAGIGVGHVCCAPMAIDIFTCKSLPARG